MESPRPELARDLRLSHAMAVVVGTIIGSGIFLVPAEMMQAAGSAKLVYLAWLLGGLLSFFGALTYAELGAMKPQAGGEYVYIRDGYGPLPGFLYAWTWFLIAKPASIATLATGFVRVLGNFPALSFFSGNLTSIPFRISYGQLVAILAAVLISILNYIGIKRAGDFQLVFTFLKVAIILSIVVIGFSYSGGNWQNFAGSFSGARGGMAGFMAALVAALWAYDGWNDLNMVSGEVRNPERNIPRGFDLRCGAGGRFIHAGECSRAVCAASECHRRLASAGFGRHGGGAGKSWRRHRVGGHGTFHAGRNEWHGHERRARPVCCGSRPVFLLGFGGGASSISYSLGRYRGTSHTRHPPAAVGRKLSPVLLIGDFRRVALLYDRGEHDICVPAARSASRPALPGLGISCGPRAVCSCFGGAAVLHIPGQFSQFWLGISGDSGWHTCFLWFCPETFGKHLKLHSR